jgi:hypothetical protein
MKTKLRETLKELAICLAIMIATALISIAIEKGTLQVLQAIDKIIEQP